MTVHDVHWMKVKEDAEQRLAQIFAGGDVRVADVLGHDAGVSDRHDLAKLLGYVFCHGDTHEKTCAMLASVDWSQAANELAESKPLLAAGAVQ